MAKIKPFKGIRFNVKEKENLQNLICPPYDIISAADQEYYYKKNEHNIIRIEFGKELANDDEKNNKYSRASAFLSNWIKQDVLQRESQPAIYIYQQQFKLKSGQDFTRTGIIALTEIEELSKGVILAHENTLSKPKSDRMNLMKECGANISPIYVLFEDEDQKVKKEILSFISNNQPTIDFVGLNEIKERLWVLTCENTIEFIEREFYSKKLYIADGHHRYETALNFKKEASQSQLYRYSEASSNYTMMLMVDMADPGLLILPTHRAIKGLKNFDKDNFLINSKEEFEVVVHRFESDSLEKRAEEVEKYLDGSVPGVFVLYSANSTDFIVFKLKSLESMEKVFPTKHPSFRELDVCILHKLLLEKFLGIGEEQLASQEFLTYTHSVMEGIEWTEAGDCDMVFFMAPTSVTQIRDVSLAGEKMPQKSTYFYPKPPTGLVLNKF